MDYIITNKNEKFKSIFVSINFLLPLVKEDMSKNALIAMLLKKGKNEKETERELANLYSAKLYTNVEKLDNNYNLQIILEILNEKYIDEKFEKAIEFLIQIITNPLNKEYNFKLEEVEREKINLKQKIKEEKDDKRKYALKKAEEILFESDVYGYPTLGKIQDIENIDTETLNTYYKQILLNNMPIIIVTGNSQNLEKTSYNIKSKLERELVGSNLNKEVRNLPKKPNNIKNRDFIEEVEEKEDINQSIVVIGLIIENPDKQDVYKALIFDKILGGTPASKLFQNVREKESLAYFAKSIYNRQKEVMYMFAGIDPNNYKKAKNIMLKQIKEIEKDLKEEELICAKDYLISIYEQAEDSKFEAGRILFTNQIYFNKNITALDMIKELKDVNLEQIKEFAKKIKPVKIFILGGKTNE